jgi:hypothetical protein
MRGKERDFMTEGLLSTKRSEMTATWMIEKKACRGQEKSDCEAKSALFLLI